MSTVWQVQEAKNHFSEMIEQALSDGPQVITRHGRPVVRVVAATADVGLFSATRGSQVQKTDFAQYLLSMPRQDDFQPPVRRSRKHPIALGG